MSAQTDAEVRELEHAGWKVDVFTDTHTLVRVEAPRGHGGRLIVEHDLDSCELALRAALAAAWVLVGNPWGGDKSPPTDGVSPSKSRGTNPGYPGHGGPA